ncbi:hypothetical protein PybrP1_004350 [[Pythium] brassicae (nom. inval.)]|nr:hypothetical protein PybrP1_004350 [[Pythium] brassicae (nom. inval.)]
MLGTWLRLKYPHVVNGVIAASAPIRAFMGDKQHPVDTEGFQRVVTFDMSAQAGSAPNCVGNVRRALSRLLELATSADGRQELMRALRVCESNPLRSEADVAAVVNAVVDAYGNLAMGNYPYPSSYMTSGASVLPAYPMRAACEHLKDDFREADSTALLAALRESVGVFLNSTKRETCFFPAVTPTTIVSENDNNGSDNDDSERAERIAAINAKGNFYSYIECAELYAPFSRDGVRDAFPAAAVDLTGDDAACFAQWQVRIRPDWAVTEFGGLKALRATSNIVLSNGDYDPWSAIGVAESVSDSVVYLPIASGAHHLDLFFSHPLDPLAVTQARAVEKQHIRRWIDEFYASRSRRQP